MVDLVGGWDLQKVKEYLNPDTVLLDPLDWPVTTSRPYERRMHAEAILCFGDPDETGAACLVKEAGVWHLGLTVGREIACAYACGTDLEAAIWEL